jgi:chorismate synthase
MTRKPIREERCGSKHTEKREKGCPIMSSTFGELFKITTFGESHCKGVGVVVDGVPPGMALTEVDIQPQLTRRRPGQSDLTTPRDEADQVTIQSGTEFGKTLGTPVSMFVANKDQRPGDYGEMADIPRPSHADYTYMMKYGIKASSGGGRSSARETIGRVAAGAIAEKFLQEKYGIEIVAWVSSVGDVEAGPIDINSITRNAVDASPVRCPDAPTADLMLKCIETVRDASDSTGGTVCCVCRGVPAGWGEPVFDKLEAMLAHAMLSIPATKGFEIGSGFAGTALKGSEHNDPFVQKNGVLGTTTNHSGGVQGGISNGEPIILKLAFKPPATIGQAQQTADFNGNATTLEAKGRHDPCVVPRAVPIVEAMAALVLADAALRQEARAAVMG